MASKLEMHLIYLLWDQYMLENDPYFMIYLVVATVCKNKKTILKTEISQLPSELSKLNVENE